MIKARNKLEKMASKGFRGYPVATIAYYGQDEDIATKAAVGIVLNDKDSQPEFLEKWYKKGGDIRFDDSIHEEILKYIERHNAISLAMPYQIIGCIHEEGIDYPIGEDCPQCPYWKERERWIDRKYH